MLSAVSLLNHQPRCVPLSTRLTALFGSGFQPFGWLFFGFGMMFTLVFAGNADLSSLLTFRGALGEAEGVIVSSEKSAYSEGGSSRGSGSRRRGTPIYRHDYTFEINGITHLGISYSKGGVLMTGHKVQVEFPHGRPGTSRIKGMRNAPFGPWVLLVLIFPVVGLAFVVPGLTSGWKSCRLLTEGVLAKARLTGKQRTNIQVNKQHVYKLIFQYTDRLGQNHQVETRTHRPEKLEDDSEEQVLYDPLRPARAVLVDALPGAPMISEDEQVEATRLKSVLAAILPPMIALLVVGVAVVLKSI